MQNKEAQKLIDLLDAIEDGVVVINSDYTIEHMNIAVVNILGEGKGQKCYQVINRLDEVCPDCKLTEVIEQGKTVNRDYYIRRLDKTFALKEIPFQNPDATVSKLTIYRDITPVKKREKALRASEQDYKSLFEHVACGVFISSKEGKFLDANHALLDMLGYPNKEEFFKINLAKDLWLKPEDRQKFQQLIEQNGRVIDYEAYFKRKEGTPIPFLLTSHVRYDEHGNILGYEGLNVDQSQRKKMEKELEETRMQLLQAEKMASLGKLAAGVAHQLNNPLGGIILLTKLVMEEYSLEEKAKADLKRVLKDAERCRDTVKELLEFSRQTHYLMKPCDINQAISRTLFLLENQSLFQNIDIKKDLAPSLPPVRADVQQLNHLFMNIILNSAEAMDGNGNLTVRTHALPNSKHISIEISDTGPGIPPDTLPQIFEPFFTTKEEGKGTGLGLSLAYGIVENHEGSIRATSQTGQGTKFTIELPIETTRRKGDKSGEGI
ncbi:MAG: PAS domain-containing protein [Deltaproteobacteria bacterium]|nr:MAG: PAS domain-containing protein [Deltaproteobacteria bacterium]